MQIEGPEQQPLLSEYEVMERVLPPAVVELGVPKRVVVQDSGHPTIRVLFVSRLIFRLDAGHRRPNNMSVVIIKRAGEPSDAHYGSSFGFRRGSRTGSMS